MADLDAVALPVPHDLVHTAAQSDQYAGSRACTGCHRKEAESHARTGHARAVRPVSSARDGPFFRRGASLRDPRLGLTHSAEDSKQGAVIRSRGLGVALDTTLDLAIGSGTHGISYMHLDPDGGALVPRISLYRTGGRMEWDWTPGLGPEKFGEEPRGQRLPPNGAASCVGCHSTTIQSPIRLDKTELGVNCERCHGPAREHLQVLARGGSSVSSGSVDPGMPRLARLSGPQVLSLCNTCHRPLGKTRPDGLPDDLARAQPVALAMSRCFQSSSGRLSCVSCHDPHAQTRKEPAHYERVCLSCHAPGAPVGTAAGTLRPKPCPVNASSGCVGCHMSRERLKQFNTAVFTNHWIRRRPETARRSPVDRAAPVSGAGM